MVTGEEPCTEYEGAVWYRRRNAPDRVRRIRADRRGQSGNYRSHKESHIRVVLSMETDICVVMA